MSVASNVVSVTVPVSMIIAFINANRAMLVRRARKICGEDAEDAVQSTAVKFLKRENWTVRSVPRAAFQVLKTVSFDLRSKWTPPAEYSVDHAIMNGFEPISPIDLGEIDTTAWLSQSGLTEKELELAAMLMADVPVCEIAATLDTTPENVRKMKSRLREKVEELIQ